MRAVAIPKAAAGIRYGILYMAQLTNTRELDGSFHIKVSMRSSTLCVCICVYACMCVCTYVCVYVCVYVCMCVCSIREKTLKGHASVKELAKQ